MNNINKPLMNKTAFCRVFICRKGGTVFLLIFLFVALILPGCKKNVADIPSDPATMKEDTLMFCFGQLLPSDLVYKAKQELEYRKSLPGYLIYVDSLSKATQCLYSLLMKNNQLTNFRSTMNNLNSEINNGIKTSGLSPECYLKSLGMGFGKGIEVSFGSSIGVALLILEEFEFNGGGGAKVIYDFNNLERQVFYFSVCSKDDPNGLQGSGLGIALSSGFGFQGFIEYMTGFRYQVHGIDQYAGPMDLRQYTIGIDINFIFGGDINLINAGNWQKHEGSCNWQYIMFLNCPDCFNGPNTSLSGITVGVGGSLSAGFALMIYLRDSKIGVCSEPIDFTYTNFGKDQSGRLIAATSMACELLSPENSLGPGLNMSLAGSPDAAAIAMLYGLYDPGLCPNSPPGQPYNPTPASGALEQDEFLTLFWNCSDPDGDPLTYDIYLGANGQLVFQGSTTNKYYTVNNLKEGTNYTWQVKAKDDKSAVTSGPKWYFRTSGTLNHPPVAPYEPDPADGAIDTPISLSLKWSGADPDNDPLRYHIYFGTEQNPGLYESNLAQTFLPVQNLISDTKYYWKVVAEDDHNHFTDGPIWSFTTTANGNGPPCPGIPSIQIQGKTYHTVLIGSHCWLRENIEHETGTSWCYNNDPSYCSYYGRLYDYQTAVSVCPQGWHLPSDDEWKEMEIFLGMSQSEVDLTGWRGTDQGSQLKPGGTTGFSALMAGTYNLGFFSEMSVNGYFWTGSSATSTNAWIRMVGTSGSKIARYQGLKNNGLSVRCLKDD